jgi:hypothetical protein
MLSLKFNKVDGVDRWRWIFLAGSVLLVPILGPAALFGMYIWFILASFIAFRGKSNTAES